MVKGCVVRLSQSFIDLKRTRNTEIKLTMGILKVGNILRSCNSFLSSILETKPESTWCLLKRMSDEVIWNTIQTTTMKDVKMFAQ